MNYYHKIILDFLNTIFLIPLFTCLLLVQNIQSQTLENTSSLIDFNPPPGIPNSNSSGGRRGNFCNQETSISFMAIFPDNKEYHLTSLERPNFYIYLPETTTTEGYFFLDNYETGAEIYYTSMPITHSNSLIKIEFPKNSPPLQENIIYKWGFGLICDNDNNNMDFVDGLIQKVDFTLPENAHLSLDIAKIYGKNGIWYDALDVLIQLYQIEPNNQEILDNLQSLLRQGEIDDLLTEFRITR
jgi:hypothetical protein